MRWSGTLRRVARFRRQSREIDGNSTTHGVSAPQKMVDELDEPRTGRGARHILGRRGAQSLEAAHVGNAHRALEEGEHRRVVRRIAYEHHLAAVAVQVAVEALGK